MMFNLFNRKPFKCFTEEYGNLKVKNKYYLGIKPIPMKKIVGSVGRCHDFDSKGNFKWADTYHFNAIRELSDYGGELPPIKVYKVCGEYYILDGHHRFVAARMSDRLYIDADIIELSFAGEKKEPDYSNCTRKEFEEKTGLFGIIFEKKEKYRELLHSFEEKISKYMDGSSLKKIAASWYKNEYLPLIEDEPLYQDQRGKTEDEDSSCI